jgi:2-amino-4-hydroxy-6-hydroxymethyldihydropteridine diphosphokinase
MTECLLALGSNLGERAATLDSAIAMLDALENVRVVRHSSWQMTLPVGGENLRREFLNGAAIVEASREPEELLAILQQIERSHGRERHERWGDRTLDLDLLLYGDRIVETPALTVPHPRMSFRRFVLEPAVEIAGDWVHPTIGWTLAELAHHLDTGADCLAIVSPDDVARRELTERMIERADFVPTDKPLEDAKWPASWTTWLEPSAASADSSNRSPKLSILLDPLGECDAAWDAIARASGRGPTLRIAAASRELVAEEVFAAISSVWPRLGSPHP